MKSSDLRLGPKYESPCSSRTCRFWNSGPEDTSTNVSVVIKSLSTEPPASRTVYRDRTPFSKLLCTVAEGEKLFMLTVQQPKLELVWSTAMKTSPTLLNGDHLRFKHPHSQHIQLLRQQAWKQKRKQSSNSTTPLLSFLTTQERTNSKQWSFFPWVPTLLLLLTV